MLELAEPEKRQDAVMCLNELIMNALGHVPDVIEYLSRIRNQSVFNFCAIPQVRQQLGQIGLLWNAKFTFQELYCTGCWLVSTRDV